MKTKLIVGLGNPGDKYKNNRHNVGFLFIDWLINDMGFVANFRNKCDALIQQEVVNGTKVIFAKPTTFMNLSGGAVKQLLDYFNIEVEDLVVIVDDIDMDFGTEKLKMNGGHGGQNGIRNIIDQLKTDEFARLKIGVGKDSNVDVANHVLSDFSKKEMEQLPNMFAAIKKKVDL